MEKKHIEYCKHKYIYLSNITVFLTEVLFEGIQYALRNPVGVSKLIWLAAHEQYVCAVCR